MTSPEDIERIVNGDNEASREQIGVIRGLANVLTENITPERIQTTSVSTEDGSLSVHLTASTYQIGENHQPNVVMTIVDPTHKEHFGIVFGRNNNITRFKGPDQEDYDQTIVACDELLGSTYVDPDIRSAIKCIKKLIEFSHDPTKFLYTEPGQSEPDANVADLIRNILPRIEGEKYRLIRDYSYGSQFPSQLDVRVSQEINGEIASEPVTEVVIYEPSTRLERYLTLSEEGARIRETLEDEDNRGYHEEAEVLWANRLQSDQSEVFIRMLMEASIMEFFDEERDGEVLYPVMSFSFDEANFYDEDGLININNVTEELIRSINARVKREESTAVKEIPYYSRSDKKNERTSKFLRQRVKSQTGDKETREDLLDFDIACQQVIEKLDDENHPVAQAFASLYYHYADLIGENDFQCITTELIKTTHPSEIRKLYLDQTTNWRLGKVAVSR